MALLRRLLPGPKRPKVPRALGVLLCYNDADVLPDAIEALLDSNHALIAWDHGSDDGTAAVLDRYAPHLVERKFVPRSFDFYKLYPAMSKTLVKDYAHRFDWISWPDQDEILEGPTRAKSYWEWILEAWESPYSWVQFNNFNFWFTSEDDESVASPSRRIRHYSLFPDCSPRIRAWKAEATNIREFNHNPPRGEKFPQNFNLRHYPMRTVEQMRRRLEKDRAGLQRGGSNYHYNNMKSHEAQLFIEAERLHCDDGRSELDREVAFDWRQLYGNAAAGGR